MYQHRGTQAWPPPFTLPRTTASTTGSCATRTAEVGHYPTGEEAELVAERIAKKHDEEEEMVIHLPDGRTNRKSFAKGWLARWFSA
jgi:hypothetical protein